MSKVDEMAPYFEKNYPLIEIGRLFGVTEARVSYLKRQWIKGKHPKVTFFTIMKRDLIKIGCHDALATKICNLFIRHRLGRSKMEVKESFNDILNGTIHVRNFGAVSKEWMKKLIIYWDGGENEAS